MTSMKRKMKRFRLDLTCPLSARCLHESDGMGGGTGPHGILTKVGQSVSHLLISDDDVAFCCAHDVLLVISLTLGQWQGYGPHPFYRMSHAILAAAMRLLTPPPSDSPMNYPSLLVSPASAKTLLALYDYPHPLKPHAVIKGYDKAHALRTAKMCAVVALHLGHDPARVHQFHIACLLHDLGRAGLDQRLFGKIWSWARRHNIPTRPAEWRARHPNTGYGRETEAFVKAYRQPLADEGLPLTTWGREQVEMRLGFARRHRRQLKKAKPTLKHLGIRWLPWMEQVTLYYYYPEKLTTSPAWVKELGQILVACEQLEAYSNRRRGKDYYVRSQERFHEAFAYLDALTRQRRLSARVVSALRRLTAAGLFDALLKAARGGTLSRSEQRFLRSL